MELFIRYFLTIFVLIGLMQGSRAHLLAAICAAVSSQPYGEIAYLFLKKSYTYIVEIFLRAGRIPFQNPQFFWENFF
jgi:hypothetical protein